ncbi:DUF805 domain-containing protein [Chryseobacterium sp. T1]
MFRKPFSFTGRIRRTEYWLSVVLYFVTISIVNVLKYELAGSSALSLIPLFWFIIAQGAKRCHDLGSSGWYQIIPFYGLWMLFQDGYRGTNLYGDDPKRSNFIQEININKLQKNIAFTDTKPLTLTVPDGKEEYEKAMTFYNGTNDIGEQSFSKAVVHLKEAVEKGYPQAKEVLANCFYNGDGVEQSYIEAVSLWEDLSKQGFGNALYNLGLCYYLGKGVEKDNNKAIEFLRQSCEKFNDKACTLLNRVKKETENIY